LASIMTRSKVAMTSSTPGPAGRDRSYSISDLCREFGITARTLRFYEQKGLLLPGRRGWTRLFSYRDRARLQLILRGKRLGFSLDEIKEMLDHYTVRDGEFTQLKVASAKLRERLQALIQRRIEMDETIAELQRTCDIVEGMLKECLAKPSGAAA
jgi:DNA-binding transcriptional MerR regulator